MASFNPRKETWKEIHDQDQEPEEAHQDILIEQEEVAVKMIRSNDQERPKHSNKEVKKEQVPIKEEESSLESLTKKSKVWKSLTYQRLERTFLKNRLK